MTECTFDAKSCHNLFSFALLCWETSHHFIDYSLLEHFEKAGLDKVRMVSFIRGK